MRGVREKPAGPGAVLLSARRVARGIEVVVWDDGVGIEPQEIRAALAGGSRTDQHSFGVWNIHQRLRGGFSPRSRTGSS